MIVFPSAKKIDSDRLMFELSATTRRTSWFPGRRFQHPMPPPCSMGKEIFDTALARATLTAVTSRPMAGEAGDPITLESAGEAFRHSQIRLTHIGVPGWPATGKS